jgi:hypothetical protein
METGSFIFVTLVVDNPMDEWMSYAGVTGI